jgi:hypothetical protein
LLDYQLIILDYLSFLLFFPPFVGGAGVICAIIAKTKNEKLWGIGLAASIVGGALGALLGVMIWG